MLRDSRDKMIDLFVKDINIDLNQPINMNSENRQKVRSMVFDLGFDRVDYTRSSPDGSYSEFWIKGSDKIDIHWAAREKTNKTSRVGDSVVIVGLRNRNDALVGQTGKIISETTVGLGIEKEPYFTIDLDIPWNNPDGSKLDVVGRAESEVELLS